jgi:hypothetical protein
MVNAAYRPYKKLSKSIGIAAKRPKDLGVFRWHDKRIKTLGEISIC